MKDESTRSVKVVATQRGIYGKRERVKGDIFTIADMTAFSKSWMSTKIPEVADIVETPPPAKPPGGRKNVAKGPDVPPAGPTDTTPPTGAADVL
jgi:hypothetical protein